MSCDLSKVINSTLGHHQLSENSNPMSLIYTKYWHIRNKDKTANAFEVGRCMLCVFGLIVDDALIGHSTLTHMSSFSRMFGVIETEFSIRYIRCCINILIMCWPCHCACEVVSFVLDWINSSYKNRIELISKQNKLNCEAACPPQWPGWAK